MPEPMWGSLTPQFLLQPSPARCPLVRRYRTSSSSLKTSTATRGVDAAVLVIAPLKSSHVTLANWQVFGSGRRVLQAATVSATASTKGPLPCLPLRTFGMPATDPLNGSMFHVDCFVWLSAGGVPVPHAALGITREERFLAADSFFSSAFDLRSCWWTTTLTKRTTHRRAPCLTFPNCAAETPGNASLRRADNLLWSSLSLLEQLAAYLRAKPCAHARSS